MGEEYSRDYDLNKLDIFLQKTNLLEFTRIEYLKNIFKDRQTDIYVKENGQYIKPGNAKSDDARDYSIDRLPLQEHYFKEILAFCKEEKIPVFLCMLPSRSNAVVNYSEAQIKEFNEFIQDHLSDSVRLLDYSRQEGWSLSDYTDIVHLNAAAADRFSKQVSDSIQSLIKLKSDQQEVGLSF